MPRLPGPLRELLILGAIGVILLLTFRVVLPHALGVDSPITVVQGPSMKPTYEDGDILIIKRVEPEELSVGDVIVYRNPLRGNRLVVHRIVEIKSGPEGLTFITQGDNPVTNPRPDTVVVTPDMIVGIPVLHIPIPILGHLLMWLQKPVARVLLISALALLFVQDALSSMKGAKKEEEESDTEAETDAMETPC
ncbi:MAG TPA: signal peptidase I [Candidatus Korarchaeota archaeon]|nr:signal peptidase I [Candidatus Korarchaeota archaeon]